jgi:hypothetical protein
VIPPPSRLRSILTLGTILLPLTAAGQITNAQIYSFLSDKCLQPVNESSAQGAPIVQQPCNTHPAQQWTVVHVGGNVVHYVNQLSGMCLDAHGGAANYTPVQQWTCNKISNENWEPGPDIDDTIPPLYSRISGGKSFCLDIPGGQTTASLAMQIYRCNDSLAQDWWLPE